MDSNRAATCLRCEPEHEMNPEPTRSAWPQSLSPRASPDRLSPRATPGSVSPERYQRSLSSPVRRLALEAERIMSEGVRSPLASTATPASIGQLSPCRMHSPPPAHYHPSQMQYGILNRGSGCSVSEFGRVSAYFSMQPPAVPMQLVPVTPPALPARPSTPALPAPDSLALTAPIAQIAPVGDSTLSDNEKCQNAVRSMLCELMATLPLTPSSCGSPVRRARQPLPVRPAPPPPTLTPLPATPPTPDQVYAGYSTRSVSPDLASLNHVDNRRPPLECDGHETNDTFPLVWLDGTRRDVLRDAATQAHATVNSRCVNDTQERPESTDEWLGGVRALRDSHVRLVLRQLRHIERLNRALDRAVRPPSSPHTPPAAPPAHTKRYNDTKC
ncbi:histone acetyltransferase p300-like isoform X2 [Trichoplusia ni]|uniref:Histone acetyltransferase p300-like isoform X2 n=1 Tax=Trichoplusia ni TaxID=7111 RepID=A0A7E5WP36_TRINI|nr:histone acetyltransferase p300-like isoform X2 [Trichoplusia ni]